MRINKLSFVAGMALGALIACGSLANAQDTKDGGGKEGKKGKGPPTVEQVLEKMTKDLSLTDEQKPKVKAVLEENRKKMQELFNSGTDRDQMRAKRREISDEQDKKLKEILKPDQYEKWEKMRDEMRKGGKRGGGGDNKGAGENKN